MADYAVALQAGLLASLTAQMFLSHTYRLVPLIPLAIAAALGGLWRRAQAAEAAEAPESRKSASTDWKHYLAVPAVTLAGIAILYMVVAAGL